MLSLFMHSKSTLRKFHDGLSPTALVVTSDCTCFCENAAPVSMSQDRLLLIVTMGRALNILVKNSSAIAAGPVKLTGLYTFAPAGVDPIQHLH